jgi:uncharacterized membrane protein (DUF106 family)
MKKNIAVLVVGLILGAAVSFAAQVHDWKDLDAVHKHVKESIKEMERARAANHYDMDGHGEKAEAHLRDAERELHDAVESAKKAH